MSGIGIQTWKEEDDKDHRRILLSTVEELDSDMEATHGVKSNIGKLSVLNNMGTASDQ